MYVDRAVSGSAKQLVDALGLSLTNKSVSANLKKVNDANVATQTYADNSAVATYSQAVSNTSTVLRNKTINGNFFTLKVNDVSVLTSLLSTADFTMLTM